MIGAISPSDVANEMSMMRSVFKGTFLVVEGASDCRLYTKFIDKKNVRIVVAHSKTTVMQAVDNVVRKRCDDKVIGFVDRDMDSLLGKKTKAPIFQTDKRDMETTILSTNALDDMRNTGTPQRSRSSLRNTVPSEIPWLEQLLPWVC